MLHSTAASRPCGSIDRRKFLQALAWTAPAFSAIATGRFGHAADPPGEAYYPGLITRQSSPENLEFPFASLNSVLTPTDRFYVRSHFNVPALKAADWSLRVEGHIQRPFEIGLDELRTLESRSTTALLECAGNGRIFLQPQQAGLRWEQGGVGNAEWTGAPLAQLLERAGVKSGAVEVILEGHDAGKVGAPGPAGDIPFARSIPLDKALHAETLLAWQMNGEDLTPAHGYPVRAVIPGWYGMASVKWLKRIIVTDRRFDGYFQTFSYTIWQRNSDGLATLVPVTELAVKSQIARPMSHEVVAAGSEYRIHGAAWTGESQIAQVDVSTDGGQSWYPAELDGESAPYGWRLFHDRWQVPKAPGDYVLMSRATDERGRVQPLQRDEDLRDAMISHVQRIAVRVK